MVIRMPPPIAVPFSISHLVCTCEKNWHAIPHPYDDNGWACGYCLKYYRYVLFNCEECDEKFIGTFQHPNRCNKRNDICWHCLQESDPCEHLECGNEGTYVLEKNLERREFEISPDDFDLDF